MSETIHVLIDFTQAGLELEPEELEAYSLRLVEEMREIADAGLVREAESPDGAMPGDAKFDLGFLKAEINFANLKKLLDWLGNLFYGRTLELQYEEDGRKVAFKYRTNLELNAQIQAIERLAAIQKVKISVVDKQADS